MTGAGKTGPLPHLTPVDGGAAQSEEQRRACLPRISGLVAKIDAGEAGALRQLKERIGVDYEALMSAGDIELAGAAMGWLREREADVELAASYAELDDDPDAEAPACWEGLRVRVTHVAHGGMQRPTQVAGRLVGVTEFGARVLIDELEESADEATLGAAGSVVRRVVSERFVA